LLDLLTIFFLVKFTKKPLRFFGLVGTALLGLGVAASIYVVIQRFFFDVALADRPALVFSSLLIILGIQIIAIGLIGEIIIFTHAKDLKEYKIDKIIN
jgi:NO-binding membrane sensor protein with MHYT domain